MCVELPNDVKEYINTYIRNIIPDFAPCINITKLTESKKYLPYPAKEDYSYALINVSFDGYSGICYKYNVNATITPFKPLEYSISVKQDASFDNIVFKVLVELTNILSGP